MGGTDYGGAGVGHCGHSSLAYQAHVVAFQRRLQQVLGVKAALMIPFFMDLSRQLLQLHGLYRCAQRVNIGHAFEVSTGGFGVFADPVL
jgi:hypothetical protein